ncbi:hypothetical protein ZIOFF_021282 [Zingiber officinale]|uniref:RHOMBOID-like protein n=1 Tax=Zingiber officinale TaxID=94328 RepID=A0A8J5H3L8_ZINOF|nr:hypothetical protein ZIOFF_021282 [Zingiber officinale]
MADVEPGTAAKRQASGGGAYYYETAEEEERAWVPWLVPGFVLACVGVFVAEMYVNNCPAHPHPLGSCVAGFLHRFSFQPTRQNPLLGPSSSTSSLEWKVCTLVHLPLLRQLGENGGSRMEQSSPPESRLEVALLCLAPRRARPFDLRIGTVYILSGFGGAVLSALLLRNNISVGASGALFGLLGSMLSELVINWAIYSNRVSTLLFLKSLVKKISKLSPLLQIAALLTLILIIIINLVIGLFPSVDNFAHIGGFLSGFLLGFVLLIRPQFGWMERHDLPPSAQVTSKYKAYQCVLWVLGLILLIAGWLDHALQGSERERPLPLVPLPELCANVQLELITDGHKPALWFIGALTITFTKNPNREIDDPIPPPIGLPQPVAKQVQVVLRPPEIRHRNLRRRHAPRTPAAAGPAADLHRYRPRRRRERQSHLLVPARIPAAAAVNARDDGLATTNIAAYAGTDRHEGGGVPQTAELFRGDDGDLYCGCAFHPLLLCLTEKPIAEML